MFLRKLEFSKDHFHVDLSTYEAITIYTILFIVFVDIFEKEHS